MRRKEKKKAGDAALCWGKNGDKGNKNVLARISSTNMPYSTSATLVPLKSCLRVSNSWWRAEFNREMTVGPPSLTRRCWTRFEGLKWGLMVVSQYC